MTKRMIELCKEMVADKNLTSDDKRKLIIGWIQAIENIKELQTTINYLKDELLLLDEKRILDCLTR